MQQRKKGEQRDRRGAVIFDFDGTIAESLPAVIQVFETLTKKPQKFTNQQIQEFRDLSVPELVKALKIPRWKAPLLLFRGRKLLRGHLKGIPLNPGMAEAIKALYAKGVPLYVLSSNSTENVHDYMEQHGLGQYFQAMYGNASLLGKAPRLLKLVDAEHLDVASTWYVGDEVRDVSAARSVGFKMAAVSWGYNTHAALATKEPDLLVDTPAELLKGIEASWKK